MLSFILQIINTLFSQEQLTGCQSLFDSLLKAGQVAVSVVPRCEAAKARDTSACTSTLHRAQCPSMSTSNWTMLYLGLWHSMVNMHQNWLSQAYWSHLFCIIAHRSVIGEYGPASLLKILFPQCFFFFVMKMRGDCHPELSSDVELEPMEPLRFRLYCMCCRALPKKWPVKINKANVSQPGK